MSNYSTIWWSLDFIKVYVQYVENKPTYLIMLLVSENVPYEYEIYEYIIKDHIDEYYEIKISIDLIAHTHDIKNKIFI